MCSGCSRGSPVSACSACGTWNAKPPRLTRRGRRAPGVSRRCSRPRGSTRNRVHVLGLPRTRVSTRARQAATSVLRPCPLCVVQKVLAHFGIHATTVAEVQRQEALRVHDLSRTDRDQVLGVEIFGGLALDEDGVGTTLQHRLHGRGVGLDTCSGPLAAMRVWRSAVARRCGRTGRRPAERLDAGVVGRASEALPPQGGSLVSPGDLAAVDQTTPPPREFVRLRLAIRLAGQRTVLIGPPALLSPAAYMPPRNLRALGGSSPGARP